MQAGIGVGMKGDGVKGDFFQGFDTGG